MRTGLLLAVIAPLLLTACASSAVQKVGGTSYAPLAPSADVALFTDESHVKKQYEVIAKISYSDPGKYQILELSNAFEPLKAKAREAGANGVIVDHSETIYSCVISRGISVHARAILLSAVPSASTGAPAAGPPDPKAAAESLRQLQNCMKTA
jgi:hypothetical protein